MMLPDFEYEVKQRCYKVTVFILGTNADGTYEVESGDESYFTSEQAANDYAAAVKQRHTIGLDTYVSAKVDVIDIHGYKTIHDTQFDFNPWR